MYASGVGKKDIAAHFTRDISTIDRILKKEGLILPLKPKWEAETKRYVEEYVSGLSPMEIARKHNVSYNSVISRLIYTNEYKPVYDRISDEVKQDIQYIYSTYGSNAVFAKYPSITKQSIYTLMSKNKIKCNVDNEWLKDDEEYLSMHYRDMDSISIQKNLSTYHSTGAIKCKARKLGVSRVERWTQEEDAILREYYTSCFVPDVLKMLPGRGYNGILVRAKKLGLVSAFKNEQTWRDEEIQFIKDNWVLLPDIEMSATLNRTFRSVKWKREELGLFRQDKDCKNYESLSKFLRGNISEWKNNSMKNSGYTCVVTGKAFDDIHHLYSVSNMLRDTLSQLNIPLKKFSEYNDRDLYIILDKFLEIQNMYPLGACVTHDIHLLFHKLYGKGYNTPEQWYRFCKNYKDGKYRSHAA